MKHLLLIFTLIPIVLFGGEREKQALQKKMDRFIEKYNTTVHAECPKVYKGQMAGYATGGGINVRNQVFNRRPLTVTLPSYSAGCGGIDIHTGGFSY